MNAPRRLRSKIGRVESLESRQMLTATLVQDLATDSAGFGLYHTQGPDSVEFDGSIYLSLGRQQDGFEVWKSDGTIEGTKLAIELAEGADGSNPGSFHQLGDKLVFTTNIGKDGQVWASDGTQQGTVSLGTFSLGGRPQIVPMDGELLIVGSMMPGLGEGALWRTDGTLEGTTQIETPPDFWYTGSIVRLKESVLLPTLNNGSYLVNSDFEISPFLAQRRFDGFSTRQLDTRIVSVDSQQTSLWSVDIETKEEIQLAEFQPGSGIYWADNTHFAVHEENESISLWKTDGTVEGTKSVVEDSLMPFGDFYRKGVMEFGDGVFFITQVEQTYQLSHLDYASGEQTLIHQTDGPAKNTFSPYIALRLFASNDESVYFVEHSPESEGDMLWRVTGGQKELVVSLPRIHSFIDEVDGKFVFLADDQMVPKHGHSI